jgi:hypothetical protein
MFFRQFLLRITAGALCAAALVLPAAAGEPEPAPELWGVCVTDVPDRGTVLLGDRVIRSGDVLTAEQFARLTCRAGASEADARMVMAYLPIRKDGVGQEAELVISIPGQKNGAPTAANSKMETYKNLPNEGLLDVSDPEGDALTYTLTRAPKRGEVVLRPDGSFLYTPKKNKVGTDSVTYTAPASEGGVSNEATVTIEILKPSDDRRYADTAADCRFEAEWLRNTGIFAGETVNGQLCFSPDEAVSRGQFLAMLMQVLDLPVDRGAEQTGFLDENPAWLKPYLAAALRSGIITGIPTEGGVEFQSERAVSAEEAALMVQRALDFALPAASIDLPEQDGSPMTRADTARWLYRLDAARRERGLFGFAG